MNPDAADTGGTPTTEQRDALARDRVRDALVRHCPGCWSSDAPLPANLVCLDASGNIVWGHEFLSAIPEGDEGADAQVIEGLDVVIN